MHIILCLALLLSGCGDWLRTPCGCPIGTICQPDPLTPGATTCGPAPKETETP